MIGTCRREDEPAPSKKLISFRLIWKKCKYKMLLYLLATSYWLLATGRSLEPRGEIVNRNQNRGKKDAYPDRKRDYHKRLN